MKKWTIVSSVRPSFRSHGEDTEIAAGTIESVAGVPWRDIPTHVKYFGNVIVKGRVRPDQFEWIDSNVPPKFTTRKLRANWTIELAQDIEAYNDPLIMKELEKMVAKELANQVDQAIINTIKDAKDDK